MDIQEIESYEKEVDVECRYGGSLEGPREGKLSHKLMQSGLEIISEESDIFTETVIRGNVNADRSKDLDA